MSSTDSFVFSMLRQHCDYVSPELEQAYLDPFVMMLTACAVPVLIRIADILMAAIGAGAAVASKRINGSRSSGDDDERAAARAGETERPQDEEDLESGVQQHAGIAREDRAVQNPLRLGTKTMQILRPGTRNTAANEVELVEHQAVARVTNARDDAIASISQADESDTAMNEHGEKDQGEEQVFHDLSLAGRA